VKLLSFDTDATYIANALSGTRELDVVKPSWISLERVNEDGSDSCGRNCEQLRQASKGIIAAKLSKKTRAKSTIACYNASVVKTYSATNSMAGF
jgi:hypothetical protein